MGTGAMKKVYRVRHDITWGETYSAWALIGVMALLVFTVGCGGVSRQAASPPQVGGNPSPAAPLAGVVSSESEDYLLGEGDLLEFTFIRQPSPVQADYRLKVGDGIKLSFPYYPELNTELTIPPPGTIYLPKIDPLYVINLTVAELQSRLKSEYARRLTQPEVLVNLTSFHSEAKEFFASLSYGDRGYSREAAVRSDGKVSMPLIGDVMAAGLTPAQLHKTIQNKYRNQIPEVTVSLNVRQEVSKKVLVLGEVHNGGIFQLTSRLTPLEAVALAGGHTTQANLKKVVLVRKTQAQRPLTMVINVSQPLDSGLASNDIYLKPYDIVYVPKKRISRMNIAMQELYLLLPSFTSMGFGYSLNPR